MTTEPLPATSRIHSITGSIPKKYVYISTQQQKLTLYENGTIRAAYSISTSRFGIGNRDGSLQTPPGIHRIREKIGAGAPAGRIFRDRIDTGETCCIGQAGSNMILTRIIRLEGLEDGVNRGNGIDSYDRYIYLHGTNNEHRIGTPLSLGCVCMNNTDIIALFDMVKEGDIVVID
jgi:lipoprotein-anchoring transpeptidase ErfK/SrfK